MYNCCWTPERSLCDLSAYGSKNSDVREVDCARGKDEGGAPSFGCHDFLCRLGVDRGYDIDTELKQRGRTPVGVAWREVPDVGRGIAEMEERWLFALRNTTSGAVAE